MQINTDSYEMAKNYEITPEGYLKFWLTGGIPNKELEYEDGRRESIKPEALFDEQSIKSAIGKPITLNHPPQAINSLNYRNFSCGIVMQEYTKDSEGALVLAGVIHDEDVVKSVIRGDLKYVSPGYTAKKESNMDGSYLQSNREYNHFALLTKEFAPRGGKQSKIHILSDMYQNQIDSNSANDKKMEAEIAERLELLTTWKNQLESNNISIDYSLDSKGIKRQILGIYYPEKTMKLVNESNIDGCWLGFVTNTDTRNQTDLELLPDSNFDSTTESVVEKFIKKMEGKS